MLKDAEIIVNVDNLVEQINLRVDYKRGKIFINIVCELRQEDIFIMTRLKKIVSK